MKPNYSIFLFLAFQPFVFSSCSDSVQEELKEPEEITNNVLPNDQFSVIKGETTSNIRLERNEETINNSFNNFGLRFFNAVSKDINNNIAVSPVSNCFALAMMANVCDEDYEKSVCDAFGCDNISSLNTLCHKLMMYLPNEYAYSEVSIANSVWHAPYLLPTDNFTAQMNEKYYADIVPIDFSVPQAADTINLWVDKKTNGMIKDFVDFSKICGADFMALNALYFNGGWWTPFDKKNTRKATFSGSEKQSEVDFMNLTEKLPYCKSEFGEWIYLPYSGGTYNLILALPDHNRSIEEFLQEFDPAYLSGKNIANISDKIIVAEPEVNLSLPKFNISTEMFCDKYFEELGIAQVSKGFKGMEGPANDLSHDLHILHKTVMNIDEEGSSAASASANVSIIFSGEETAEDLTHVDLKFNRPFVYFICNTKTGSIMIAGKVTQL